MTRLDPVTTQRSLLIQSGQPTWPLWDTQGSREIEAFALRQHPPHVLMREAGLATAKLAMAIKPFAKRIRVFAGGGNNGGDGLVAAHFLRAWGKDVHIELTPSDKPPSNDFAWARRCAVDAGVPISPILSTSSGATPEIDLAIDALLGLGQSRPMEGTLAIAAARCREVAETVLAIDVPSGLNADTGDRWGETVVRADHTLTLLNLKPGLFTAFGRDMAGQVWLNPLGPTEQPVPPCCELETGRAVALIGQSRQYASHKGSYGDVMVAGGAAGMTGAAVLAARAALAGGAGRVFVRLLDDTANNFDSSNAELMFRDGPSLFAPEVLKATTVVCGCGAGAQISDLLSSLLAHADKLVLDADALNAIASSQLLQKQTQQRSVLGGLTIMTPHPLEAARLLGSSTAAAQAHRIRAATQLADEFGCVVVLKGSGSIVTARGLRPSINLSGNASLASAGSGDVLAGWTGGAWSALREPKNMATACGVARAVVALHGLAADHFAGVQGNALALEANRLIAAMRQALKTRST